MAMAASEIEALIKAAIPDAPATATTMRPPSFQSSSVASRA
jgi:hypothetical protein